MKEESPFFRAMVLMGSSIAVGCGGVTRTEEGSGGAAGGATSVQGEGGAVATPPTVGAPAVGFGAGGFPPPSIPPPAPTNTAPPGMSTELPPVMGQISDAGAPRGSGGSHSVVEGGVIITDPECPLEQWDCSSTDIMCDGGRTGWKFTPLGCKCDPSRPRTKADCKQGDVFVCQAFTSLPDGGFGTYDQLTPFQCQCVSGATSCEATCRNSFPARSRPTECAQGQTDNYLCGCAIVFLK